MTFKKGSKTYRQKDVTSPDWVRLEKTIQKWFEETAENRWLVSFGDYYKGLGLNGGKRGSKEYEDRGDALHALYTLDKKRHAAGLPIFSVLIKFENEPSSALVNLLRELGLIKNGQSMEEIIEVVQRLREHTWKHYGAEGLPH
jgi:hypothetical protein